MRGSGVGITALYIPEKRFELRDTTIRQIDGLVTNGISTADISCTRCST